jgi:hypothetical protein
MTKFKHFIVTLANARVQWSIRSRGDAVHSYLLPAAQWISAFAEMTILLLITNY